MRRVLGTRQAFDRGARHYDLLVSLNPGYHDHLRGAASALVERLAGRPQPWRLVDLACGSGASTRALLDAVADGTVIDGLDASPGMLAQARAKQWPDTVCFDLAVAGELDVASVGASTRDGILSAYLFRNVAPPTRDRAVREAYDLLAPGGWLVVQEYSVRGRPFARLVWTLVCWLVIIPLAVVVARHPSLYTYLWRSALAFDSTERFMARLAAAGFVDVATRTVPGWQRGILHVFVARKPEQGPEQGPDPGNVSDLS